MGNKIFEILVLVFSNLILPLISDVLFEIRKEKRDEEK